MESDWGGWAEWGPPLGVMAFAIVFGWFTVSRMRVSEDPSVERESRRLDLLSARDESIAALKQLELDKDKLPANEYQQERDRLIHRGARALEALENPELAAQLLMRPRTQVAAQSAPIGAPAAGPLGALSPEWRGALYALGAVLLIGILWNFAGGYTKPKDPGMGGQTPQGGGGQQAASGPMTERGKQISESPVFKEDVAKEEAKLVANPSDIAALNQLTYLFLMMADNPQKAFGYNEQAIKIDPKNEDTRAYRAVLTAMMSMPDKAIAMLDEILKGNPAHEPSIIYRAMILIQMGRKDEAISALEAAAQAHPESQEIASTLEEAKRMPNGPQGGPPPAAGGERLAAGTVTIDPAARAMLTGTETLYLSIKAPASPPGMPPVAAEKFPGPLTFPMSFDLTTAHIRAMPGAGGVPGVFDVTARIDSDGNAMTKEAGPIAVVTGVAKGAGGLVLNLSLTGGPTAAPPPAPGNGLLAPLPGAPSGAVAASGEVLAAGTASLGPGVQLTGSEVVYVSVKDPAGGPPVAALQLPAQFPLQFKLTTANVVQMGPTPRVIPATLNVTVRIDKDGNAMTKEGAEAMLQGVQKGSSGLTLTLQ